MIERFNFYDVYGNLLPGLAFLGLLWLPFGITQHFWPSTAFTSAVAALAFAYILGHILQSFASTVFGSKARDSRGRHRYPSSFFLDPEDATFPSEFKQRLQQEVAARFGLNLNVSAYGGEAKEIDTQRRAAFFLCRGLLIREEIVSYGEQFEGLYALMRGLAISFWLASAYFLGWAASSWDNHCFRRLMFYGIFAGLAVATIATGILVIGKVRDDQVVSVDAFTFAGVLIFLLCLGVIFGTAQKLGSGDVTMLCVIALSALFAGGRCFRGYRFYARQFAGAIWRDFAENRSGHESSTHQDH
ncbi:MAG: hypothetical protein WAK89_11535 [Candidatus Sulfotelmatobacter sp.]